MLKVYCDSGAFRPELKELESKGSIKVYQFKYENKNKNIKNIANPSTPTWAEMNCSWNELAGLTWCDLGGQSDKREAIARLIGGAHARDIKHLESAYMSGCKVFLTSDKRDISSKRIELESLLEIKVFHFHDHWTDFLGLIEYKK